MYEGPGDWLTAVSRDDDLVDRAIAVALPNCAADPPSADWAAVLALAYWKCQRYQDGLAVLERVDQRQVSSAEFFVLFGMLCRKLPEQEARAEQAYRQALQFDPQRADVHYNLANLLKEHSAERALPHYVASLTTDPLGPSVWHNYGACLTDCGHLSEADAALRCSLRLDPDNADAWCNLGICLFQQQRFDPSKACFLKAIALDQSHAISHVNYGQVLIETLEPESALAVLRRGVALDRSSSNALWNLSLALLLLGQYREGWRYYEARFHTDEFGKHQPPTLHNLPRELEALPGPGDRELVVWSEQGIGDGLQFSRYLRLLQARDVPFVFLAHKPLIRLYRDWMGLGDAVAHALNTARESDPRANVSLLSLPLLFQTELHSVPSFTPYLQPPGPPPPHLELPEAPGGLAVGVVWATNPANKAMYRNKSMPANLLLPPLVDLINLDLIEVHSLQVGDDAAQLAPWQGQERLTDWNGVLTDFADTAHLIQQLDLVICVDTAVAHLAGALQKPTWLLLAHNADFRWLHRRSDTPWYPTMRLFRQPRRGDWAGVMAEVQEALNQLFLLDLPALADAKLNR